MITIIIEPRRTLNLKQAITDAIGSGDYDHLHDDIQSCFMDDQVEEIEEVLENGDIGEAIEDIITDWGGDALDELLETIETYFQENSVKIEFDEDEGLLDEDDIDIDVDSLDDDSDEEEDEPLEEEEP